MRHWEELSGNLENLGVSVLDCFTYARNDKNLDQVPIMF